MRIVSAALFITALFACGETNKGIDPGPLGPFDAGTLPDTASTPDPGPVEDTSPAIDTAPPPIDLANPDPGALGWPCDSNDDCESGYCIEGENGYICTEICVDVCPPGFTCKGIQSANDDIIFVCVPPPPVKASTCEACENHGNCLGEGSACIALDNGNYCGKGCTDNSQCDEGYTCETIEGIQVAQCVPTSGSCQCQEDNVGLARSCTVEAVSTDPNQPGNLCTGFQRCEATGWAVCTLPEEICDGLDNNCDGQVDENFKNQLGEYASVEHCGGCGLSCQALSVPNGITACDLSTGNPTCTFSCNPPWQDVDGISDNGCECQPTSDIDLPDIAGIDEDCDGVDGEIEKAIFVSKAGDDANSGTMDAPLQSVQAGIDKAMNTGTAHVYVATGVYQENIQLANAVAIYGGYSADFAVRDLDAYQTALIGTQPKVFTPGTVNGVGVGVVPGTVLDGFSIFGGKDNAPGGSSYGIYLKDVSSHLEITNNIIVANDGSPASSGLNGSNGIDGINGNDGVTAVNVGSQSCNASHEAAGGSGGALVCTGINNSGGNGGRRICPDAPADVQNATQSPAPSENGGTGLNNVFGAGSGGDAGWDLLVGFSSCGVCSSSKNHPTDGGDGLNGLSGPDGSAGSSCASNFSNNVSASGLWFGSSGTAGEAGYPGGGGGGGGAGGGVDVKSTCWPGKTVGGSGGGGGSGGCPGSGGQPGGPGGASFGIFAYWSSAPGSFPLVQDNVIYRGFGGTGGDGGAGGVGGAGGLGGAGGSDGTGQGDFPINFCGSGGGYGGAGGFGGAGGGGAGGCGGPSYGFYVHDMGSIAPKDSMISNSYPTTGGAGAGGQGGFSAGFGGPSGNVGAYEARNF